MKSCVIYSKNPTLYKSNLSEDDSQYGLVELEKLITDQKKIQFIDSKTNSVKNPKNDYIVIVEDDYDTIGKLLKYSNDCGEIENIIFCTDAESANKLLVFFNKEPDLITLDFQLRNDDKFIEETTKLYNAIKSKWEDVPVIGITQFESKMGKDGVAGLIALINKKWDSVYDKSIIWTSLPTILRDKIRISRLNKVIEKIKDENEKKEQIIENLEAKSKNDFVQLYFNRKIDIDRIEAVKPADIYRKYNLISSNSFVTKCLLYKAITNAATSDPVIVSGPIGSGKDIIPKIIHDNSSRKLQKYEVYDCTKADAADPKIIITELFGAKGGVATGVSTQPGILRRITGGTIFLDELHHLPLDVQKMFLRVIQNNEIVPMGGSAEKIDVRIIAGTNQDINQLVVDRKFHSDLFSRLCRDIIIVPTLEQRGKEEIILIAKFYLQKYCENNSITHKTFSAEAINKLSEYNYPNYHIRELEGIIANAAKYSNDDNIINEDQIVFNLPEFQTSSPIKTIKEGDPINDAAQPALKSFEMNKSKEWLRCLITAIGNFDSHVSISSRQLITVFVSPAGGTYSSDASFSPAINYHIENILMIIETEEFSEYKEKILKLNVIRRAFQKKINSNRK